MENPQPKSLNSLTDDELDAISGGYILDNGEDAGEFRYMLVHERTGITFAYCGDLGEMENLVDAHNAHYNDDFMYASKRIITRGQYQEIFGRDWDRTMYYGH